MELDTKSISILNKPPKTVIFRCLLTINHERHKPLFCPKTLARQALELQVFRPESLRYLIPIFGVHGYLRGKCRMSRLGAGDSAIGVNFRLKTIGNVACS